MHKFELDDGTAWFGKPAGKLGIADPDNAANWISDLAERADKAQDWRLAKMLATNAPLGRFLAAVLDLSPFMRDFVLRRPEVLEQLYDQPLDARLTQLVDTIRRSASEADSESALMADLRRAKAESQFLIALSDLAGVAGPAATVCRMSELADASIGAAVSFLLREAGRRGDLKLDDPEEPEKNCGLIVLGMGKLGAFELNYSSDIDLVLFYDSRSPALVDPLQTGDLFSRMARQMVRILQTRNEHGYVFRTDLRLRPDPGSTPLAISSDAALHYYESRGQNWERAAMIKARPVAGDIPAGKAFLHELDPYVWRRYMDFAAIADVHSIKRQIHAHKGHGEVTVKGHNIKLGRGGIREIEFFVQTQQLIGGGRFPELRGRQTTAMLEQLAVSGWIDRQTETDLIDAYWALRDIEHRIQMVGDEQTHTLPEDDTELTRMALMCGHENSDKFSVYLRQILTTVERYYGDLFETEPVLSSDIGNLVFTGDVDDPDTLETLQNMGFERPSDICRIIRAWHYGRYRATQSAEARERLTELTPALLNAFGKTQRADEALLNFDAFLKGLPAGIQLFSLLQSNPPLLQQVITIMGAAPRLAGIITRRPHVFDGMLDPSLLSQLPDMNYLQDRLGSFLTGIDEYEEILDRLRVFASEQKFLIGMRLLNGTIGAERAGKALSDVADLTIAAALKVVSEEVSVRHGSIGGGRVAILGMGKLGSRELTAGSDVDLILLYDHDESVEYSDGSRPLAPSQYYMRLTQRLIAAVSAPTSEGVLYSLDLRLRPSGNKGPVATHIAAFEKYQRSDAWTWEHMAMTRARVIAGNNHFGTEIEQKIGEILAIPRSHAKILSDAREMRSLIADEKPPKDAWDLKYVPGGLIDLEFIAQVAVLTGAVDSLRNLHGTAQVLTNLPAEYCDPQVRDELVDAHSLYSSLTQLIRMCITGDFDREDVPPGLAEILLRSTDLPELGVLEAHIEETARRVRHHFNSIVPV